MHMGGKKVTFTINFLSYYENKCSIFLKKVSFPMSYYNITVKTQVSKVLGAFLQTKCIL